MPVYSSRNAKRENDLHLQFKGKLHPTFTVDDYIKSLSKYDDEFHSFTFDFSECTRAFPNAILPVASDFLILQRGGLECSYIPPKPGPLATIFETTGVSHLFDNIKFQRPTTASDRHLAIVHVASPEMQHSLVSETIDLLMRSTQLNESILNGFRWAFNEITGNIFDHSNSNIGGLVQLDVHKGTNRLSLCVCDPGIGIYKSLKSAGLHQSVSSDLEAIEHSIRRGFTSNPEKNQGNGLAGSLDLARAFHGRFAVRSGKGLLVWEHDKDLSQKHDCENMSGTLVDMQLDMDIHVDNLGEIITGDPSTGYEPYDVIEEGYLDLDSDRLLIQVKNETFGFGSRQAGVQMYNKCKNLLHNSKNKLVIDWSDVPLIASSYADEFIGKLYADIGPLDFPSRVTMQGMDKTTKHILNSAISQRMSERYRKS